MPPTTTIDELHQTVSFFIGSVRPAPEMFARAASASAGGGVSLEEWLRLARRLRLGQAPLPPIVTRCCLPATWQGGHGPKVPGPGLPEAELQRVFRHFDREGAGVLGFPQFQRAVDRSVFLRTRGPREWIEWGWRSV